MRPVITADPDPVKKNETGWILISYAYEIFSGRSKTSSL
jgi:hypothetical protein